MANLDIDKKVLNNLIRLAKAKNQPVQKLAEEFIQKAIEYEEDMAIVKLAAQRDTRSVNKKRPIFIRHEDVNLGLNSSNI